MILARCLRGFGRLSALAALVLLCGCQYRWGGVGHPQIQSLAVGAFANESRESAAVASLRGSLAEMISTEPELRLAQPDQADAIVEGRVLRVDQRAHARAKTRDERDAEDDGDAYQTVLYRVEVTVEYSVRVPGYEKPLIAARRVTGVSDMGNWPDQQVFRASALSRALGDAATQIVAEVTESW